MNSRRYRLGIALVGKMQFQSRLQTRRQSGVSAADTATNPFQVGSNIEVRGHY